VIARVMLRASWLMLVIVACLLIIGVNSIEAKQSQKLPPHWKQWVKTCRAEQPATLRGYKGNKWKGIAWHQTRNYTYKGGCGFTQLNWDQHKRKGQPRYMSDASPLEQLWACERIYTYYLKQLGSHRAAATVWAANKNILGWYGFTEETW
jgi:hypothetical protein